MVLGRKGSLNTIYGWPFRYAANYLLNKEWFDLLSTHGQTAQDVPCFLQNLSSGVEIDQR